MVYSLWVWTNVYTDMYPSVRILCNTKSSSWARFPPSLLDLSWQYFRSALVPRHATWGPYLSFLQWRAQSLPCLSVLKPPSPGTWGGAHGQMGRWLLSVSGPSVGIQPAAVHSVKTEVWAGRKMSAYWHPATLLPGCIWGKHGERYLCSDVGMWVWAEGGCPWHIWGPTCSNILCWEEGPQQVQAEHRCLEQPLGLLQWWQKACQPPWPLSLQILGQICTQGAPRQAYESSKKEPMKLYSLISNPSPGETFKQVYINIMVDVDNCPIKLRDSFLKFKK